MENDLKDTNLKKPYYPVNLDARLIPLIMAVFGEDVEKIEYPDSSIEITLKGNEDIFPPF